jgi:hypothetical protein
VFILPKIFSSKQTQYSSRKATATPRKTAGASDDDPNPWELTPTAHPLVSRLLRDNDEVTRQRSSGSIHPIQPTGPGFLLLPRVLAPTKPRQVGPTRVDACSGLGTERNRQQNKDSGIPPHHRGRPPLDIPSIPDPTARHPTDGRTARDAAARARQPAAAWPPRLPSRLVTSSREPLRV